MWQKVNIRWACCLMWICVSILNVILGAFAELWKATVSFVMSPSIHVEQLGSQGMYFHEILYLSIFLEICQENLCFIKSDKNHVYFTWRPIFFVWSCLTRFFLEWEMLQTNVVEKNNPLPRKSCCLWDSVKKDGTAR